VTNGGYADEEPGYATIVDSPSDGWKPQSSTTSPKTTTRTYTAADGSLITEVSSMTSIEIDVGYNAVKGVVSTFTTRRVCLRDL